MARRKANLNETIQQLGDVPVADALGMGNVQIVEPGIQPLDNQADLVFMAIDAPATIVLPPVDKAILSYAYKARNIGSENLTIVISQLDGPALFDGGTPLIILPPVSTVTIAAVELTPGNAQWLIIDVTGAAVAAPVDSVHGRTGAVVSADDDYTFNQLSGDLVDSNTTEISTSLRLAPDGTGGVEWAGGPGGSPVSSVHGRTGVVVSAVGDYTFSQIAGDIEDSVTVDADTTKVLSPNGVGGVEWRAETGGSKPYAYAREDGEDEVDNYGPARQRFNRDSTLHASSGFSGGTSGCQVTYTDAATTNFHATVSGQFVRGGGLDESLTLQISVNDLTVIRCRMLLALDQNLPFSMSGILPGVEQDDTIEIYLDDVNGNIRTTDWGLTLVGI